MPATKDVTLDQVADFLFAQMFNDPKLKDVPANERAGYVSQRFNALAEEVAEKKAEAKVTGLRTQLTDMHTAMSELQERVKRREAFQPMDHGYHLGADGRMQPNVTRESAKDLRTLVQALRTKDIDGARAVSSGVGSEGGYVLKEDVATDVLRLIPQISLYPQIARPFPMTDGKLNVGAVISGMTPFWIGENTAITPSFPGFDKVQLEAKQLGAFIPIPISLLDDAVIDFGQLIADLIRECIGKEIDRVGIAGKVASGDPFNGLLNSTGVLVKAMNAGEVSMNKFNADYLLDLQDLIPEGAEEDESYLFAKSVFNYLRKAKDADGQPVFERPTDGEAGSIYNKPYFKTNRMPAYSAAAQPSKRFVLHGDWKRWALFGMRKELVIATSDVAGEAFQKYQLVVRGITRVALASFGPAFSVLETAAV